MLSRENTKLALETFKKGRSNQPIIKAYETNPEVVIDRYIDFAQNMPLYVHVPHRIYDGIERKVRVIIVPKMNEQVVHHMALTVLKPIFMKSMYEHSYGSIPGKGCLKGKQSIEKWIRKDYANTKYYLKMDIRKYFDNVDHEILLSKLGRIINDDRFMQLLRSFIKIPLTHNEMLHSGIPLGFYTSQWFANFYLTEFDHYVKEQLRVKYYARYMDDLVVFGSNKRKLRKLEAEIAGYLKAMLKLEIKPSWRIVKLSTEDGTDLDFMGYRFYRNRTTLRRKIMYRSSAKARKLSRREKPNQREARQMLSHLGRLKHCDVYGMYLIWIKPYISVKSLKKIISKRDKWRNLCGTSQKRSETSPQIWMRFLPRQSYS